MKKQNASNATLFQRGTSHYTATCLDSHWITVRHSHKTFKTKHYFQLLAVYLLLKHTGWPNVMSPYTKKWRKSVYPSIEERNTAFILCKELEKLPCFEDFVWTWWWVAGLLVSVAGLPARSQYPEGPATGYLGKGFFLVSLCL